MGGDQLAGAAAAAAAAPYASAAVNVLRDEQRPPGAQHSVYHSEPTPGTALLRVTSPPPSAPTTARPSMSMSQPPLLPPLQQQNYDGAAHLQGAAAQPPYTPAAPPAGAAQPMNAPQSMYQHHAHPPPYQPHVAQQHHHHNPFAYQNGAAPMQHAPPPPPMASPMMVNGSSGAVRYALPPQMTPGNNMASRTAHAKQIKRRTKTGCLTCRKRRIKCDEAHPTCRNCQKSKRECLGYDTPFKQQPGPSPIQPAPSSAAATASTKSVSPSTAQSNTYSPSQSYSGAVGGFITSPDPGQGESTFGFAPSLDPALGPGEQPFAMAQTMGPALQPARRVSLVTMAELYALNDIQPQWQQREAPPPDFPFPEIEPFYRFHYAQGLDKLLETTWYTTHGWAHMQHDGALLDFVGQCSERMKSPNAADTDATASLEARLVWQLAIMPRSALSSNQAYGAISDPLLSDLLPRIDTVENILTGQFLPLVQIPSPPSLEHQSDARKHNEMHFWHQLGRIASIHDDTPDPAATRDINDALAAMRGVLGLMENRDVLYSLAIVRFIGGRVEGYEPLTPLARTGNVESEVDKLETARAFVAVEGEKGMTQVIQRVCGMAMRGAVLVRR